VNEPPNSPPKPSEPEREPDADPTEPVPASPEGTAPDQVSAAEGAPPAPDPAPVAAPAEPVPASAEPPPWTPPPPIEAAATGPVFGGFWIRFAAYIIDSLILGVISFVMGWVLGFALGLAGSSVSMAQQVGGVAGLVVSVLYFTWSWVRSGSTPGMSLMGLQVVRDADGGPISWGKALIRYVGLIISTLVLFIGLIWVAFDRRKRGWHDLMAGTVVIRKPEVPITGGRKVLMIGAIGCGCLLPILAILGIVGLIFMGPIVQDIFGDVADDLARSSAGEITQPVPISFESLRVGDCFNIVNPDDPATVGLEAVPCADEHVFEVFFAEDMPAGAYPGEEAVTTFANDNCLPAFEEYVGVSFVESVWYASPLGPTEVDWDDGIQRVTCQLHNQEGTPVTGSARGSAE
jgi:uncharacterized RDD family membrane protein YckC